MTDVASRRGDCPSKDDAHAKLLSMGTAILFEKVLTTSDANGSGRIVIPKVLAFMEVPPRFHFILQSQAEVHFPDIEAQTGIPLNVFDTFNKKHQLRYRFWINNASRMYLLENTQDVIERYAMTVGDVLIFARNSDGQYFVSGRRGTKEDFSRKTATKRLTESASTKRSSKTSKPPPQQSQAHDLQLSGIPKSKRQRIKQEMQAPGIPNLVPSYWSGYSMPPRRDGVFRAMLPGSTPETDKVMSQHGCWTAIVNIRGEPFQAFFETQEAATDALQAALCIHAVSASDARVIVQTSQEGKNGMPPQRRASLGQLADAAAMLPGLHSLAAAAAL